MRAAVFHGPRDLRIETVPEPDPGPGDVKLRVRFNGICGSDLHEYYDGPLTTRNTPHPLTGVKNPVIMGHELCGEVVALGAGVEDLAVGDLVAVEPLETCGRCLYCGLGQYNHCPLVALHGYNRAGGGLAEFTVVRRRMAHRLPPGVTAMQGALIEPLGIAWHTANRCARRGGPDGCNPRRRAHRDRRLSDAAPPRRRDHHHRSVAGAPRGAGAPGRQVIDRPDGLRSVEAVRDLTGGRGAHASVDAAGVPKAFHAMLHGTRVDGTAVVVAIHHEPVVIPPFDLLMPEVRLTGVAMSVNAFPSVIADMARGGYTLDGWVETIPLEAVIDRGFERLRRQEGMKILVDIG